MNSPVVALDALLVTDRPTGVGRSILELTRALASRPRGLRFRLLVTCPEPFAFLGEAPEWEIVPCPSARGGAWRKAFFTQTRLPGLCRRLHAAILHSLQFVAPLRLPCASVVTVHDLAWQVFPGTVEEPRRTYYQLVVPPTLKRAAAVVTNSEATAADVRRLHPGVPEIRVTPFGTPTWVAEQVPEVPPEDVAGFGSRPFFLFVGTLEPRKNLEGLLEAYSRVLDRPGDWPALLLVGGRGWRDSGLRRRIEPLQKAGHLQVLDYCGTEKLGALYRAAVALLFPSLHEGFGFPILEAMALGLPVLTAGNGAMAEVAGEAALLVEPQDTEALAGGIERLARDPDLRQRLVLGGRQRAARWTWERTASATLEVYHSVLGRR